MTAPILFFLAFFLLLIGFMLLTILYVIDLKTMYLPDKYVFPFALCGVGFHALTAFQILPLEHVIFGGMFGFGLLFLVRYFGTLYYKTEAMGLGDVKLFGAAGLWLGPLMLAYALSIGAFCVVVHGILVAFANKKSSGKFSLKRLKIPAGPGFIVGIALVMMYSILIPLIG